MSRPIAFPRDHFTPVAIAATALIAAAVYANALANGFVLDDRWVVLDNALIHHVSGLWRAWVNPYWPPEHPAGQYRPLAIVSFTVDWLIAGGDARWFHAMNVVWHAIASVLTWALLRRVLSPAGALFGAVVFAVHPVHVEAVANVVGRAEAMAAAFAVAAMIAHSRRSWTAIPLFALALASKESAIVFLGLAIAWDVVTERSPLPALRARRVLYAGYLLVAVAYAATLLALFRGQPFVDTAVLWNAATAGQRLLTVLTVLPQYVRLLVAPAWLSADYNPRIINLATTFTPMVALGAVLLVLWVVGIATAWRRSRAVAFGLLWVPIALSPVANVLFASGIVLAERTLYLPSVGACLLFGAAFERIALRRAVLAIAGAALATGLLGARTWTRTPIWRSNRVLILTTAEDHPESYKIHHRMAGILMNLRDTAAAHREYAIATRLFASDPYLYREIAEASLMQQDPRRAIANLDTAIALMPDHPSPHLRLGDARFMIGDWDGAIAAARRGWQLAPDSARAMIIAGVAAQAAGRPSLAVEAFREGLRRHPDDWRLYAGLARALIAAGDTAGATAAADSARRLSGDSAAVLQIEIGAISNPAPGRVNTPGILQDTVQNTGAGRP